MSMQQEQHTAAGVVLHGGDLVSGESMFSSCLQGGHHHPRREES